MADFRVLSPLAHEKGHVSTLSTHSTQEDRPSLRLMIVIKPHDCD